MSKGESYFWSPGEIEALHQLYPHASKAEIQRQIHRPWNGIMSKAFEEGIRREARRRYPGWQPVDPTEYELGYLAGMIDGEGTIAIARRRDLRYRFGCSYRINVYISNTSKAAIDELKRICGDSKAVIPSKRNGPWKPSYRYLIPTGVVRRLLPRLKLTIKREQQEIVLRLLEHQRPLQWRGEELNSLWEHCWAELRRLNRRGAIPA